MPALRFLPAYARRGKSIWAPTLHARESRRAARCLFGFRTDDIIVTSGWFQRQGFDRIQSARKCSHPYPGNRTDDGIVTSGRPTPTARVDRLRSARKCSHARQQIDRRETNLVLGAGRRDLPQPSARRGSISSFSSCTRRRQIVRRFVGGVAINELRVRDLLFARLRSSTASRDHGQTSLALERFAAE